MRGGGMMRGLYYASEVTRMKRWIVGIFSIAVWVNIVANAWSQLQPQPIEGAVVPIPRFFGSALEWYIPNSISTDLMSLWNASPFTLARQHMVVALRSPWQNHISAFDFLYTSTGSSFWIINPDFGDRLYGGVPWSTLGRLFLEDLYFTPFAQTPYGSRVYAYEPYSETDSGSFTGQLIDVDVLYNQFLIDREVSRLYWPNVKLAMPAPTGATRGGWDYMTSMLKRGFIDLVDYVTVHPYRETAPETLVPCYAQFRSLVASYVRAGQTIPPLMASELGYGIQAIGRPTPQDDAGGNWHGILNSRDWRVRRWAKYWQRLFHVQRYCDVPLVHAYTWMVFSNTGWDGIYFPMLVIDREHNDTIEKTLAYYSVQNFADFYHLYEYYARIHLPDPYQWALIYRSRRPSSSGLRRNEWLIVVWDRYARGGAITVPIYGAKGRWYNFLGKAAPFLPGAEQGTFSFSSNQPLNLTLYPDWYDNPSNSSNPPDNYPISGPHDGSPFYYVLEQFDSNSLPELAWRVSEHVTARAGGVLQLKVEGYCPRFWNGVRPNGAVLRLRGHGVDLTASFPVEAGSWFSQHLSLPWIGRRSAVELVAELSFGQGLNYHALQTKRVVWVSVANPIDCRIAPMHKGLGLLLSSRDFAEPWSGKIRVDINDVIMEANVSLTAGGTQLVRIVSNNYDVFDVTINRIQLIDNNNRVVAEWGRRYVNLLWNNLHSENSRFPLSAWAWDGTNNTPDDRPNARANLSRSSPPSADIPFLDNNDTIVVGKLQYEFGCLTSDRMGFTLKSGTGQSVAIGYTEDVRIVSPRLRKQTEICVWLYATEPWVPLWVGVYDNQCIPNGPSCRHETSTWLESQARWKLVSFFLPHARNVHLGQNTEYISSTCVHLDICGVSNVYSAGPGELYIGPFALVHYEEEEF